MSFYSPIDEEEPDERGSFSADLFEEDSDLMPSGIDYDISDSLACQERFYRCPE
jgi:hypothetical protein